MDSRVARSLKASTLLALLSLMALLYRYRKGPLSEGTLM